LVGVKYAKYLAHGISLLRLNKDLLFILEYRNKVSICAILIKKGIDSITDRSSPINKYVYYINIMYVNFLLISESVEEGFEFGKEVVDYGCFLISAKVSKVRERPIKGYGSFFKSFCISVLCPDRSLTQLGYFIYYSKYQQYYKLDAADLSRFEKLMEISYLLIKLPVFYSWNLSKLIGASRFELLNYLKILKDGPLYELIFDESNLLNDEPLKKVNKIVKNKDFYIHRAFYEQTWLYSKLWEFFYYKNVGMNSNQYEHINQFIDIFKDLTSVISEERLELMNYRPDK
jgi:hypothetical protein